MAYSIDTLKTWRKNAKNNKKLYNKRKEAIEKAYYALKDNMNGYVDDINGKVKNCVSELNNGIQGISAVYSKTESINNNREKHYPVNDSTLSSALSYMKSDLTRCQNKIDEYDRQIANYERQIRDQGGTIYWWE